MKSSIQFALALLLIVVATVQSIDKDLEEYIENNRQAIDPRWRQKYHLSAPFGWLNDPNGFSYFNNEYHIFYQYHPYSSGWGPMHWGHYTSKNLVDWEYKPVALIPGDDFDKNGCFSGSAVDNNGIHTLFYSGNIDEVEGGVQYQNVALSTDGITYVKYPGNPVIKDLPDGVRNFRDPKVWKYDDTWYMLVGNQSPDLHGRVVLYKSIDTLDWKYLGVLAASDGTVGFMWECPDFFELNGKQVLLMSPQGMEQVKDRYKNIFQTGYFVGSFDYNTYNYTIETGFQEIDFGFDYYAAQTMQTPDGRRIIIAWMDIWDSEFKEQEGNWSCTMTLPRELKLGENNKLLMYPVEELTQLREYLIVSEILTPKTTFTPGNNNFEIIARAGIKRLKSSIGIDFIVSSNQTVHLAYDAETGKVSLDRGGGEDGIRRVEWNPQGVINWRIFVDSSSIEIFCGEGEAVFSSRIYPDQPVGIQAVGEKIAVRIYQLRQSYIDLYNKQQN